MTRPNKASRIAASAAPENVATAREARLHYWSDDAPAIRRIATKPGFRYENPRGRAITAKKVLARINKLAIPPAWTDVKICPRPDGHLQAAGRDARGRKQYKYHPRWRCIRDATKFDRLIDFVEMLPDLRSRVRRDLRLKGLPREKVLAAVVRLLETTLIRVGNEEYARHNHSFGLTTLRDQHARLGRGKVCFEFRGKSGKDHRVNVEDLRLARIVKRCRDIPGQKLFQYLDDAGQRHSIDSTDVNEYLREITGGDYTAKDFRTWGATLLAARAFSFLPSADSLAKRKRNVNQAVAAVAQILGNTPAICRKCYIHSAIIDHYMDDSLAKGLHLSTASRSLRLGVKRTPDENAVLRWLRRIQRSSAAR